MAHESARKRGGETCAAKGLSDLRTELSVKIAAVGTDVDPDWTALRMSSFDSGEPITILRFGRELRENEADHE